MFPFGKIVATPGALDVIEQEQVDAVALLRRHLSGDWGDLDAEDKAVNDRALRDGERVMSNYKLPSGKNIYIVTEADRSLTTYLLPEDY